MKKVEIMYRRTLKNYKKTWELKHTLTLNAINNLDLFYDDEDKMKKAKIMYQ